LRLTKCRKKVKIAKNQAEIDVAKDINRNSRKPNQTNPRKIIHRSYLKGEKGFLATSWQGSLRGL